MLLPVMSGRPLPFRSRMIGDFCFVFVPSFESKNTSHVFPPGCDGLGSPGVEGPPGHDGSLGGGQWQLSPPGLAGPPGVGQSSPPPFSRPITICRMFMMSDITCDTMSCCCDGGAHPPGAMLLSGSAGDVSADALAEALAAALAL